MKNIICVALLLLIGAGARAQHFYPVSGSVKNEKGEALQAVTVFIDGSDKYTTTDENGKYIFEKIGPGTYNIAASIIGYNAEQKSLLVTDAGQTVDFVMKEKSTALKEVVIGASKDSKPIDDKERRILLAIFTGKFLGYTDNARNCKIINPDIIEFSTDKKTIMATTPDFLIIENRNLGYRIKYRLKLFRYDVVSQVTGYGGECIFEELAGSARQKRNWEKSRKAVYYGSFMHYLRSLYNGNSTQQGFSTYKLNYVDSLKKWVPSDTLENMARHVNRIDSNFVKVSFKQLKVTYNRPSSGNSFPDESAPSSLQQVVMLKRGAFVQMYIDETKVDVHGNYQDYRSFFCADYWAMLQVGDKLPFTYQPVEQGPDKKVKK